MEKFIHDQNIRLYRRLLADATDAERRRVLLKLLTQVKRGVVSVRDIKRKKTVQVKAGHSYLAQP